MGSPEEGGLVDWNVGSIVWVRRRNGSWWPGKILGPDELSAAHLMSPRSGTPVKLLGREDASVDWYNLEKSKRVKAFRCGEFDACIERAESTLKMPPKKREKYARREDAILHALELEKLLLDNKSGSLGSPVNGYSNTSDAVKKELVISSEYSRYDNGNDVDLEPASMILETTIEDKYIDDRICPENIKGRSQKGGDEDIHIRDLQDLGLRNAPSKRKFSSSTSSIGSRKPDHDNFDHDLPISSLSKEKAVTPGMGGSLVKKRKPNDVLNEESLAKRRDRRRPLAQVLRIAEKLPPKSSLQLGSIAVPSPIEQEQIGQVGHAKRSKLYLRNESTNCLDNDKPVYPNQVAKSPSHVEESNFHHPTVLEEEGDSESTESTETDSSETNSVDLGEGDELVDHSDPALVTELEPKSLGISEQVRHESMSSELPNDNEMSHLYSHDPSPPCLGVSKWQIKGKRNNRSLARRSTEATGRLVARGSMYGEDLEEAESDGFDETDMIERNFRTRRSPFYNQGYSLTSAVSSKGFDGGRHNIIDWEDLAWSEQNFTRRYWEDSSNYLEPMLGSHRYGGRTKFGLVDVDLKVQSSYQREHVPMISLMSKLNGQAIIGHPIQVEVLENGASDSLLKTDGLEYSDNDTSLPSVWRTARRTAKFRIPRPHPSTTVDGEESMVQFRNVNRDKKASLKKVSMGNSGNKVNVVRKGLSHVKFSRQPQKKTSLSSNQKVKNLSAIAKEQKLRNDFRNRSKNSFQVGGLIKGESGLTAVACIPVKLVFSRLNEELVSRHQ